MCLSGTVLSQWAEYEKTREREREREKKSLVLLDSRGELGKKSERFEGGERQGESERDSVESRLQRLLAGLPEREGWASAAAGESDSKRGRGDQNHKTTRRGQLTCLRGCVCSIVRSNLIECLHTSWKRPCIFS